MLYRYSILCLVAFVISNQSSYSEEYYEYSVGLFGSASFISNRTSLPLLPGSEDCGSYRDGESLGLGFGADFSYYLKELPFSFSGRLFYSSRPIDLQESKSSYLVFNKTTSNYETLVRDYNYEGTLEYIMLAILANWQPLKAIPVKLSLGFSAGNPIVSSKISNTETIRNPYILYPNDKKTQIIEEGDLENVSTFSSALASIEAFYNLREDIFVSAEIGYQYGLNSIKSTDTWNSNSIFANVSINWRFGKEETPVREITEPPPPAPEPKVEIAVADKEKIEILSEPFELLETTVTQTYPLLPYIFFEESSSEIRKVYIQSASLSNEDDLPHNNLDIYYSILDIIGRRMKASEDFTIKLVGTSDGEELSNAEERIELSLRRANRLAKYFVEKWGIEPNRISTESRDLPKLPTSRAYKEGAEENRRVEIYSDNAELLAPVLHKDFLEYEQTKEVPASLVKDFSIEGANLIINNAGIEVKRISNIGDNSNFSFRLCADEIKKLSDKISDGSINLAIQVKKTDGDIQVFSKDVEIKKLSNSYELGRLNLIVFDFDRSEISEFNRQVINNFVSVDFAKNASAEITGSTDALGEFEYNSKLSLDRANAVADFIRSVNSKLEISKIEGIGVRQTYDNSLPEGRFYCRTVLIEVKSPKR